MNKLDTAMDSIYSKLLSERTKKSSERLIIFVAISSFILHLSIIGLEKLNILQLAKNSELSTSPIASIYTPFSFILVYEVYLLVFYLPKSTSIYIGKQYEIITLIVIRRVFSDLSKLEFTTDWFNVKTIFSFRMTWQLLRFYFF